MRFLAAITIHIALGLFVQQSGAQSSNAQSSNATAIDPSLGLIEAKPVSCRCESDPCRCGVDASVPFAMDQIDFSWLDRVKVGYDRGFVIASQSDLDLNTARYPYRLKINSWGQLRHTITNLSSADRDLNQLQLKRGRLVFSGSAFNPNFSYFVQLDARSTSGDDVRLLDYYLDYNIGNDQFGFKPGTLAFRTGKYKVPFTLSRWLSGRNFEFADRSVASLFFDVNRSFAWGLHGKSDRFEMPIVWDLACSMGWSPVVPRREAAGRWMTILPTRDVSGPTRSANGGTTIWPISNVMIAWRRASEPALPHRRLNVSGRPNSTVFASWTRVRHSLIFCPRQPRATTFHCMQSMHP